MGVNCVGKLCENPIHFVCIFIVWRFFWPKILEINRALLKLFMHMKTHFSSISTYRDLSLCNFFFSATLLYILAHIVWIMFQIQCSEVVVCVETDLKFFTNPGQLYNFCELLSDNLQKFVINPLLKKLLLIRFG